MLDKVIKEKNDKGIYEYKVAYSYGIVEYINDGESDINECIKMADAAMYEMKQKNRGC